MSLFYKDKLVKENGEFVLVLYLSPSLYEIANELGTKSNKRKIDQKLQEETEQIITERYSNIKIKMAKIMLGTLLVGTISLTAKAKNIEASEVSSNTFKIPSNEVAFVFHKVVQGDTLFLLSRNYNVSIEEIRKLNQLTSDTLKIGQSIKIPQKVSTQQLTASSRDAIKIVIDGESHQFNPPALIIDGSTFIPIRGVSEALGGQVWWDGKTRTVGIVKDNVRLSFKVGTSQAIVNGVNVSVPVSRIVDGTTYVPIRFISETMGLTVQWESDSRTITVNTPQPTEYIVSAGDTLWLIAKRFNISVDSLKQTNFLAGDVIREGQTLVIPPPVRAPEALVETSTHIGTSETTNRNLTYITHTVKSGENAWDLSVRYGIPMVELLRENGLTVDSRLMVGQTLRIPVYHIPIKPVVSSRHGELLDWWTEAQYVFTIGKTAKVTDFVTGRTFYVKRTVGANHADSEPLTARDAQIMKEIWGGSYSWKTRAIIVEVDGRRLAASMHSMPHGVQYIKDNNYEGHFCIHFQNSTLHFNGQIDQGHQTQIRLSSGTK